MSSWARTPCGAVEAGFSISIQLDDEVDAERIFNAFTEGAASSCPMDGPFDQTRKLDLRRGPIKCPHRARRRHSQFRSGSRPSSSPLPLVSHQWYYGAMRRVQWRWIRGKLALLAAVGLVFCMGVNPAIAQSEWRAPSCLYSAATSTGSLCVRATSFNRDICAALAHFAGKNDLPPDFFVRLIWTESRFRPDAVSPKGAEGIAQFISSTARLRGLSNSFDALEALQKSAEYLDDLRDRFGNLGLAAAAYNAGESGMQTFLKTGSLPQETRNYVLDITAYPARRAEIFRGGLHRTRRYAAPQAFGIRSRRQLGAVGAQLAGHFQKPVAVRLFLSTVRSLPGPLNKEKPLIQKERNRAFGARPRYTARIGRETRQEAEAVCREVRKSGGACIVFKN